MGRYYWKLHCIGLYRITAKWLPYYVQCDSLNSYTNDTQTINETCVWLISDESYNPNESASDVAEEWVIFFTLF